MRLRHFAIFSAAALLAVACADTTPAPKAGPSTAAETATPAVTMITNAEIYTVDPTRPWAESIAWDEMGVIIAVGSEADVRAAAGSDVHTLDLGGAMVLPGFQDTHVHVPEAGINADLCYLPGSDLDELEELAVECAADTDDNWVRGAGSTLFELRDSAELPVDVLDRAVPDRPALILDDLGHAVWTNTLGLQAAGIAPDDLDPQGGVFHRDPATGRLSGLLLEDAQQLVRNAAALPAATNYAALLDAVAELNRHGVTSVSDAGGYWAQGHPRAWAQAESEGTLTVRAANGLYLYPDRDIDEQLAEFESRFTNESDLLRFDTAKVYVDGILDLGTALLLDPYDFPVDPEHPSGFRYFESSVLRIYVDELHRIGYRINFHVVGDAAVREALDAIEAIDDDPDSVADRRHRATHAFLVDQADVSRFATVGVIADFQLNPDAINPVYHEDLSEIIGDRAFELIPSGKLIDAGATVTISSDWDAGPLSPLGTISRGLRRDDDPLPNLATAIALHTIEPAYALGHDDVTGSLEVGKFADLVVLADNLFDVDLLSIRDVRVLATYLGGQLVHTAPDF